VKRAAEASESHVPTRGGGGRALLFFVLLVALGGTVYWRYFRHHAKKAQHTAAHPAAPPAAGVTKPKPKPGNDKQPTGPLMTEAPEAVRPAPDAARPDAAPAVVIAPPPSPDAALPDAGAADAEPDLAKLPPEEQAEPVAPVPEVAKVEEAKVDAPETQPKPVPAKPVTSVADAQALITAGKKLEAIVGLQKLWRDNPKSAYIPYLLGNLYFERLWYTQGLQAYAGAVAADHSYRARATLNHNAIRALGAAKTASRAYAFIKIGLGRSALPYLRHAATSDPAADVRARSAALVRALEPKKLPPKKPPKKPPPKKHH
jgi:hypothetical protein